jgi:hypothetical protein
MSLPYRQYIDRRLEGKRKIDDVPAGIDINGLLVEKFRPFWIAAGEVESGFLGDAVRRKKIENPVYVCGLARAGTTLLLETLYRTGNFAAHSYRFYPYIDVPVIWDRWLRLSKGGRTPEPRQRGHLDLLDITPDSPEAMEEMIWMYFFPRAHDSAVTNVLGSAAPRPAFDSYYKDHIRKLLHICGKDRYLAKGNYNLTRISYLLSLFPDARFVIPVRRAEAHIGSLMKQHYLFTKIEQADPRAKRYTRRVGHFEFGLNRMPINCGDGAAVAEIQRCWAGGDEIHGWALYWAMIHRYIHDAILSDDKISPRVKIVRYEDLCAQPETIMKDVTDFCGAGATAFAQPVAAPDYYAAGFSAAERALIRSVTNETEALFYQKS